VAAREYRAFAPVMPLVGRHVSNCAVAVRTRSIEGLGCGKSIAANGKGAAIACAGCHGANGVPAAGAPFPRLAGLPVEYVAKQLFDYRDDSRANAIMVPIAKALTDAEIASLASH
jgi:cytochrome c553